MTIVAGFCSKDGIILCTDSEETGGISKGKVEKIKIHLLPGARHFGFAGAGWATLADFLEQELVDALRSATAPDIDVVKNTVIRVHKRYIWPNPDPEKSISALAVLHSQARTLLIRVTDGVVSVHRDYVSVGIGWEMANYWQRILMPLGCQYLPLDLVTALAVYILWQTKQSVIGCGGPTSIATFTSGGGFRWGPASLIPLQQLESSFETVLRGYGSLIATTFNPEAGLTGALDRFSEVIKTAVSGPNAFYAQIKQMREELKKQAEEENKNSNSSDFSS